MATAEKKETMDDTRKKLREIYSFTAEKEETVQKTETKEVTGENGKKETLSITKDVTEAVPYRIILKQPNRRQIEEAELEYSVEMSNCIRKGILTKAMLAKKYSDTGGLLSEEDAQELSGLYLKFGEKSGEFQKLSAKTKPTDTDKKRMDKMSGEIALLRKEIVDMETSYSSLFNHTADTRAQNKAIQWYILYLTFIQKGDEEESTPLFEGENFEGKMNDEEISFKNNTIIDTDNKSNETLDNDQNINLDKEINVSQNIEIQNNQTSKRKDKRKKSGFNIFSALQDFDRKAYTSALEKYLNLVYSGKENYEILNYISNSYFNNSQYDKAVIWFNKLISKYPKKITAENYYRASLSFKSQGAYGVSNQLLEKYIEKTNNLIVKNYYYQNPNYLDQILKNSILAEIKKTNINSENSDFGPSFYGENKLIYSSTISSTGNDLYEWTDEPFLDLFISEVDSLGNLSDPKQVTGDVNTPYHESSAILSKDKKTLYFTRNNFFKGDLDFDKNKQVNLKIYKAESEDGETWGNIQELPFNDDEFSTAHPAFSIDEKRLYFASDRPGSFGYSDIWYVDILDDGEYGDPVNLGPNINTEFRESFPFISSDNILYFSSDGRMGLGGFDIYYSNLDSYGFPDESINFGEPLNSRMDDFGFIYNSKNNFGYFSSNRNGYNGSKSDEVYQFKMLASSPCGSVLSGIVRDKNTGQILPGAEVELEDNYGNLIASQIVKEDAKYDFSNEAECSKCYTVKARKGIGYSSFQKNICIPESSTKIFTNIELDWAKDCLPDDLECLFNINPIYFDLDKYYIRRDAAKELKKVYTVMIRYPNIKIHIESHTDSRASNRYNLALSYNRARSTKSWLVKRGINEERISTSALGEMDLDNYCEDNINCQEQEHQMNRRSIFKIREN